MVMAGRRADVLEKAAQEVGHGAQAVACDVAADAGLDRLFAAVRERHGRLDILAANAGRSKPMQLAETTAAHYDGIFDLNARATLFTAQRAAALMDRGGSIVVIGSISGFIGPAGYGAYGASKAAVRSFVRTWASELAGRGIRANVVSPGPVDTAMFDAVPAEFRDMAIQNIPLHRLGRPKEVAAAALFLASDESSFVTGAELCVDGGMAQV